MPWPMPVLVRLPGSLSLRWRQSDVEAWLAVLPTRFQTTREVDARNISRAPEPLRGHERTAGRAPPRPRRGKAPTLAGEAAIWEKYKGR